MQKRIERITGQETRKQDCWHLKMKFAFGNKGISSLHSLPLPFLLSFLFPSSDFFLVTLSFSHLILILTISIKITYHWMLYPTWHKIKNNNKTLLLCTFMQYNYVFLISLLYVLALRKNYFEKKKRCHFLISIQKKSEIHIYTQGELAFMLGWT